MTEYVHICDWYAENLGEDLDQKDDLKYKIFLFGIDNNNKSSCIVVHDFTPYFYIKYPEYWDGSKTLRVIKNLVKKTRINSEDIGYNIVSRKLFQSFNNNKKYKLLRLTFKNSYSMKRVVDQLIDRSTILELTFNNYEKITGFVKNDNYKFNDNFTLNILKTGAEINIERSNVKKITIVRTRQIPINFISGIGMEKGEKLSLYESNIDPIIRFLHIKNLKACCKIKILPSMTNDVIFTNCKNEYHAHWKDVDIYDPNDISVPPLNILVFDIECNSSHGDFPLAIKDFTKTVKQILKYFLKNKLSSTKISIILKTLVDKNYEEISKIYVKNRKKYLNNDFDTISIMIYNYLTMIKLCMTSFEENKSISIDKEELSKKFITDEFNLNFVKQYEKFIENLKIDILDNKLVLTKDVKYTINYLSKKNPLNIAEEYLLELLNDRLSYNNSGIIEGDEVIQIGSCFVKQGSKECHYKNILTLKSCDKFDDETDIRCFEDERDLLLAWTNLIRDIDPDIITGFNIFNFDIPYLFERAAELNILDEFSQLSRLKDKLCPLKEKGGKLNSKFVDIPGRMQFDIYKVVKDYNLDSYKLDNVAATFIRGKLVDVKIVDEDTYLYTDNVVGLKRGNYIKLTEIKGYDNIKIGGDKKYLISEVTHEYIKINEIITIENVKDTIWTLGKDDVSAKDIFRLQRGDSKDRGVVAKYCIMDVVLCVELVNKLQIIVNNIGMSNVCSTPLSWIFTRGQGIKVLSLVSKECRQRNFVLPTLFPDTYINDNGFEGACVLTAKSGIYFEPVVTFDYASLYPRSMISENMSHETMVSKHDKKYGGDQGKTKLKSLGYTFNDIEYDDYKYLSNGKKQKAAKNNIRFVKKGEQKGIIPIILETLLKQRKITKDKIKYKVIEDNSGNKFAGIIKKNSDDVIQLKLESGEIKQIDKKDVNTIKNLYTEFERGNLDGLQLAYKVTANSIYGQIGARTSAIYCKDIAASTTAVGRKQLDIAKRYIEDNYEGSKIIYGDTDSVFAIFKQKLGNNTTENIEQTFDLAKSVAKDIAQSGVLKEPQELEFEKVFYPFILIAKKKYVGRKYEESPKKYKLTSMGIVLKRRDNAKILKLIYGDIIDIINEKMSIEPAIRYLRQALRNVLNGKFPIDKFIITKTLNDNYKNPEMIAHSVLAKRIEKRTGKKPQIGDRIGYIYIETRDQNALQGDKIETREFIESNGLNIDYYFYITNQIMKPVCQIFALSIEEIKGFSHGKDYYDKKILSLKNKKITQEKIDDTIRKEKQKETENLLFYDIKRFNENKKANVREITKWFAPK